MRPTVFAFQWRLALARPRVALLNVVVPLTLVGIVATDAVPEGAQAGVYLFLFAAFAIFGAAIPLRWDGERGMLSRVTRAGVGPSGYLIQRAAAGATLDAVQLAPALAFAGVGAGASVGEFAAVAVALLATVWIAGLVGVLIAAVSRSLPEAALFSTVLLALLAHMSGVFREPVPGSFQALLESVSPFRALHEALLAMGLGPAPAGGSGAALWAILLPVVVARSGPRLVRALGTFQRGGLEGA